MFRRTKTLRQHGITQNNDSGNSSDEDLNIGVVEKHRFKNRQIFTDKQEALLREYMIKSFRNRFGLTYVEARKLPYQFATKLKIQYPQSWDKEQIAGVDWVYAFMKRSPGLSLRTPENTSMARASAFNKKNFEYFFD